MGIGAGLYMCDVVKKSSRSLSNLLMSSCSASGSDLYWTAQLRVQRSCSVEQSATSLARKHATGYKTKLKTYLFRRSQ